MPIRPVRHLRHLLPLAAACAAALLTAVAPAQQPTPAAASPAKPLVVGYYTQWSLYNSFFVKNLVTNSSARILTHINYAFSTITDGQCASADPWADFQDPLPAASTVNGKADPQSGAAFAGNFHQLQELRQLYPNLHVSISIGGGGEDPAVFSAIAADPVRRRTFVKSCVDMYLKGQFAPGVTHPGIFDGVDIDWEYPLSPADRTNFTALLAEFRYQMDAVRKGMTLSIASSAGEWAYQYIDFKAVQKSLSFFDLMAYDFDGPWTNTTGFVAPLYKAPLDPEPTNNVAAAVQGYLAGGVDPQKIVLGVPFYGYQWTGVPSTNNGLFQPGSPVGDGAGYNQIAPLEASWPKYRDRLTLAPWLFNGTSFWTYDDPLSIAYKMVYARGQHLGGVMAWELSGDTAHATLLNTAWFMLSARQ